jgi:ribosomal protein L9
VSDYIEQAEESQPLEEDTSAAEESALANWTWLKSFSISPVVISRAIIQGQDRIFGSVSTEDVVVALKRQMGDGGVFLTSDIISFELIEDEKLQDGKLKCVGTFSGRIQIEQFEPVDFELVVKDSNK